DGIRDGHVTGVQTCALPISFFPFSLFISSSFPSRSISSLAVSHHTAPVLLSAVVPSPAPGAAHALPTPAPSTAASSWLPPPTLQIGRASCRERAWRPGAGLA